MCNKCCCGPSRYSLINELKQKEMNNIEQKKNLEISKLKANVDNLRDEIKKSRERIEDLQHCSIYLDCKGIMYNYLNGNFKVESEQLSEGTIECIKVDPMYYTTNEDYDRFISSVRMLENKGFNLTIRIVVL
jgi:hypothetical protein